MVLPVKVFEVRGLEGNIVPRLRGFRETEKIENEDVDLIVEVLDVKSSEGEVQGVLSKDFLRAE